MTDDGMMRHLLPFGRSNVVLCMDKWITDETDVAHNVHKLFGSHAVPFVAVDFRVVNLGSQK